jgi:hypothetical protein
MSISTRIMHTNNIVITWLQPKADEMCYNLIKYDKLVRQTSMGIAELYKVPSEAYKG